MARNVASCSFCWLVACTVGLCMEAVWHKPALFVALQVEDLTIYMVSTPNAKRTGHQKLLVSDKKQLHLPPDMSVVHMEYTEYFFPDGIDYPGRWEGWEGIKRHGSCGGFSPAVEAWGSVTKVCFQLVHNSFWSLTDTEQSTENLRCYMGP